MERFYTSEELAGLDKDSLTTIAEARGLEVTGTGSGGNVVIGDLVDAISEHQDMTGINPALMPVIELDQDVEKEYLVTGTHEVHGHAPGETFSMVIPADQEALLLESGAIAASPPNTKEGA